jgi:AraC family transcriptional regulator
MTCGRLPAGESGDPAVVDTHYPVPEDYPREILESGSNIFVKPRLSGLRVQVFRYKYQARFPVHSHNETSIVVCTAGLLESIQTGCREVLTPGDVIITNRNTLHSSRYGLEGQLSEGVTIDIDQTVMNPMLQSIRLSSRPVSLGAFVFLGRVHIPKAASIAREVITELRLMRLGYKAKIGVLAELIVVEVLRRWPSQLIQAVKHYEPDCLPRWDFIRVVEMMQCLTQGNFSVGQVAKAIDEPASRFSREFRVSTNLAPVDFFHRLLMTRASQLLEQPHVAVKEVAYDLGFASLSHFSSMFRVYHGVSPTAFRAQQGVPDTKALEDIPHL